MPEKVHALGSSEETRAKYYIGATIEDGRQQSGIVLGIVFEVGILDE